MSADDPDVLRIIGRGRAARGGDGRFAKKRCRFPQGIGFMEKELGTPFFIEGVQGSFLRRGGIQLRGAG